MGLIGSIIIGVLAGLFANKIMAWCPVRLTT